MVKDLSSSYRSGKAHLTLPVVAEDGFDRDPAGLCFSSSLGPRSPPKDKNISDLGQSDRSSV